MKTRQIGFSTIIAAEGLQAAATRSGYAANYISINQEEAKDKINIARQLYHSMSDDLSESGLKPVIWADAEDSIGFHGPPHTSLLISKPASSAVRGGKKDIYFDEAAHIRDFEKLYQAALPAIIRGEGRITIVSTPMAESGLFYDIATNEVEYPEFSRHVVPWWEAAVMVREGYLPEALAEASRLATSERVSRFGNQKIQSIYKSFGKDEMGFRVEFECAFVDEMAAYYPMDLIVSAVDNSPEYEFFPTGIPANWEPQGSVLLGVDLAKERDYSVFIVAEAIEEDGIVNKYVRWVYATQDPYEKQGEFLVQLVKQIKPSRVSIDKTGVGNVLYEILSRHFVAEGVVFTQKKKEDWATRFKGDLQKQVVHFPHQPELVEQIHAIKRTKTENALYKFSGKKDDYFWALMLALYGEDRPPVRFSLL